MSARLITGRPFIAGTGIYLLAQPYAQTARQAIASVADSPTPAATTIQNKALQGSALENEARQSEANRALPDKAFSSKESEAAPLTFGLMALRAAARALRQS